MGPSPLGDFSVTHLNLLDCERKEGGRERERGDGEKDWLSPIERERERLETFWM